MAKKNGNTKVLGEIRELLPNTMFKVKLPDREVLAIPSGKMRRGFMRLYPGSRVVVEFTPHDQNLGRIVAKGD